MKIALFESSITPGGHEVEFSRILVEELTRLGHNISFIVPRNFTFKHDYKIPVYRLPGDEVSYTGVKKGLSKIIVSLKREINRQRWYRDVYEQTISKDIDAVIVPTATYRYLRALNINKLKHSSKPIIFVLHGINPGQSSKFLVQMEKLKPYPNIKAAVITLSEDIFGISRPNVACVPPPAYLARDMDETSNNPDDATLDVLKLGFFGQYRREKNLDGFLESFVKGNYTRKIKLIIQGATASPEDKRDFDRICEKYSQYNNIEFLSNWVVGVEWQKLINSVDVILMPYSAPRYRYHWSSMLVTAIGYKKPVIMSDEINPEVTDKYQIGLTYKSDDWGSLQKTIEKFINTYDARRLDYAKDLGRAYEDFHPSLFAKKIADLASASGS